VSAPWTLLAAGVVGVAAGLAFFEGLWLTSVRISTARRPGLLILGSFAVRAALLLAALAIAVRAGWEVLGVTVVGVLAGRAVSLDRHRPPAPGRAVGGERWS